MNNIARIPFRWLLDWCGDGPRPDIDFEVVSIKRVFDGGSISVEIVANGSDGNKYKVGVIGTCMSIDIPQKVKA